MLVSGDGWSDVSAGEFSLRAVVRGLGLVAGPLAEDWVGGERLGRVGAIGGIVMNGAPRDDPENTQWSPMGVY